MTMNYTRTDNAEETLLAIGGSLDAMTAPELGSVIDDLVSGGVQRVRVDLEKLELIDSSGVAALVGLYKRIRSQGGRVTVEGAKDQPLAIFKLLRMDRVFDMKS